MKKFILFSFYFLLSLGFFGAQGQQIVMPRLIYTGDLVEIRYTLKTEKNPLSQGDNDENSPKIFRLKANSNFLTDYENDFTVSDGILQKTGENFTLILSIFPWKTGFLKIPRFSIENFLQNCEQTSISRISDEFSGLYIEISPIEVNSLATKIGRNEFFPQRNPLLLPGTTAFLMVIGIFTFILFSLMIFLLFNLSKVKFFAKNLLYRYNLKKNSKKTIKKIRALQKKSSKIQNDKDFAENLQHILRDFLSNRFQKDFSSATTKDLSKILTDLCGGDLSEHQGNTIDSLVSLFARLEVIRFSEKRNFQTSEREKLAENAILIVEWFSVDSTDGEE